MTVSVMSCARVRGTLGTLIGAGLAVSVAIGLVATPTVGRAPATAPVPREVSGAPGYDVEEVLSGYSRPVYVTNAGASKRLFIVEQTGRIKVATRETTASPWVKAGVFLNVRSLVHDPDQFSYTNERGLLGLAFHPDYAANGLFYVFSTRKSDSKNVLVEYQRESKLEADPSSARVVLSIPHASALNHHGGGLHFGPDGYLYLSVGDGGSDPGLARDPESRKGKILRLDPTDPPGPARFTIPADNPYVGIAGNDLVWSSGLRNPWSFSFDDETGDMWVGDVGQYRFEEVDHEAGPDSGKGLDFGWNVCEGAHEYPGDAPGPCDEAGTTLPVIEYDHGTGCALTGGRVYRGTEQTSLIGYYFFGDYCEGEIWAVPASFDAPSEAALPSPLETDLNVVGFGVDGLGELYVADLGGTIQHIVED
jgi:glucose/arabinose dehydrogenase